MSHPLYTNRLIHEKSPYLLQHAHNPVDWYPWAQEAFTAAKDLDRPIFLSIGYATCHWCHVMEMESFENEEVAHLMNQTFINVKVDREEKPEVDSLYMEFAQALMSGGAGWPLNLILTPDLLPFFAATYLPADATQGFLGMKQLILRIGQIWQDHEERDSVVQQAGKIVDVFASHVHVEGGELPGMQSIKDGVETLYKTADPTYGGTKGAPKFPIGLQALFLLRCLKKSADSRSLFYIERTLDMMHRGGIYDHLGGGFSRYSVDEKWLLPHFEKMLYDNALLARVYLETWDYTRQNFYKEVAEEIFGYILRDMTGEMGQFFSAEDADSEGQEGKFYIWSWDEINQILGKDAPLFCEYYGVVAAGNFEGRSILHMSMRHEEFAALRHMDPAVLKSKLEELRSKLFSVRERRPRPAKDDKAIVAWNGLMIHALVEGGRLFNRPLYFAAAEKAACFIKEHLWREGNLLRRWRENDARFDGCLDDYAFYIQGLISLFEADRGSKWLELALVLSSVLKQRFKQEHGAFYLTNGQDPTIILRRCEFYDGAEPSGNGIHAENLLRLYQITGIEDFRLQAADILKAAKEHIELYPPGSCCHLMALLRYYDEKAATVVVALNEKEELKDEIRKLLTGRFLPNKVVIWKRESDEELRDLVPISRTKPVIDGKTTLYICFQDRCEEPLVDLVKMQQAIESL